MSPHKRYIQEISEQLGYSATWLPTLTISPGVFGRLSAHGFETLGSISDLGLEQEVSKEAAKADIQHLSKDGATIEMEASVRLGTGDGAGCVVNFNFESAVLFAASRCSLERLSNLRNVESGLLRLYKSNKWSLEWAIVTEVITASRATILIAGAKGASVKLGWQGKADIANLALPSVRILSSNGMRTQVAGAGNLTPLFRARALRKSFFKRTPAFGVLPRGPDDDNDLGLVAVDYELD